MITNAEEKLIASVVRLQDYNEELYRYNFISKEVADDMAIRLEVMKDRIREYPFYIAKKNEDVRKRTNQEW